MGTNSHQLSILREKLFHAEKSFKNTKDQNQRSALIAQIKSIKAKIDELGKRGELKMVIVVKSVLWDEAGEYPHKRITETTFYHDLDDYSIFTLIEAQKKNGETIISKSIVGVPLGMGLASSLKENILSWQIN